MNLISPIRNTNQRIGTHGPLCVSEVGSGAMDFSCTDYTWITLLNNKVDNKLNVKKSKIEKKNQL
jgi:hypothetical protein